MYSANRFPVKLYEGGHVGYAEGGLHDEAMAVRRAGRNGDGRLVHVNDAEFADMVAEYGEPTINPETGMPEFFLGGFGKILKKVAKVALPIAATMVGGPLAGAAVGAGMGALDGGGLKGALLGGVTGGLGGAGASGAIGGKILGSAASNAAKGALGQAIISGGLGAVQGQDPLKAALMGAVTGGLQGHFAGPSAPKVPTTTAPATLSVSPSGLSTAGAQVVPSTAIPVAAPSGLDLSNAKVVPSTTGSLAVSPAAAPVKFLDRDFLGIKGLPNKYGLAGAALLAAGAYDAMKPKEDMSFPSQDAFFGSNFNGTGRTGGFRLASVGNDAPTSYEYDKKYLGYSEGGDVGDEGHSEGRSFAVQGAGTGRSDEIPAMLSDGEYVFDAETVALLGDGSTKAGAKRLDDFRIQIRKQKGRKLAKGKISHDAKRPEKYMAGGRI